VAKNQKEGPKTRRGATFLNYCIGCMQQPGGLKPEGGAKNKNGATFLNYCIGYMQQPGGQT